MHTLSLAFTFFLILNSLGLIPTVLHILGSIEEKGRKWVIFREMSIALILILLFNFLGEVFFDWLQISPSNIQMAGGLILFLIATRMIFPGNRKIEWLEEGEKPFVAPIATPLVAGPSILATVMVYAKEQESIWVMVSAIVIAWAVSLIILLSSSFLQRTLTDKGLVALQRLMGLILTLISVQMLLQGISGFVNQSFNSGV